MGVETALIASAVVGTVATAQQVSASRKSARAQKEASEIKRASQTSQEIAQRRQAARQERVRRAQILQSSENTGVTSSSGAIGAVGAVTTQSQVNQAFTSGQTVAADAISSSLQKAADSNLKAQQAGAVFSLANQAFSFTANTSSGQQRINQFFS